MPWPEGLASVRSCVSTIERGRESVDGEHSCARALMAQVMGWDERKREADVVAFHVKRWGAPGSGSALTFDSLRRWPRRVSLTARSR